MVEKDIIRSFQDIFGVYSDVEAISIFGHKLKTYNGDVNCLMHNGKTLLMMLARYIERDYGPDCNDIHKLVNILIDCGVDPSVKDSKGKFAYDYITQKYRVRLDKVKQSKLAQLLDCTRWLLEYCDKKRTDYSVKANGDIHILGHLNMYFYDNSDPRHPRIQYPLVHLTDKLKSVKGEFRLRTISLVGLEYIGTLYTDSIDEMWIPPDLKVEKGVFSLDGQENYTGQFLERQRKLAERENVFSCFDLNI